MKQLFGTSSRTAALSCLLSLFAPAVPFVVATPTLRGQAPATAPAPLRQVGTVRSLSPGRLVVVPDSGSPVNVTLGDTVRVVQLPPGSTDIKAAQPASMSDIAEGDRVLVVGRPGDNAAISATRIVLMKSAAIAQNNATRQADWQRRGFGGIVNAVDVAAKTVAITSGARKIAIETSGTTIFRRYAPGSVKFEEAKPSTLAELQPGDQLRVRGSKSPEGTTITAEEIVSGAFLNLAGTVISVDAGANTLILKDLATKKNVTVSITPESSLRNLPPEMATRLTARARGGTGSAGEPSPTSGDTVSPSGQPRRNPNATSIPAAGDGSAAPSSPSSGRPDRAAGEGPGLGGPGSPAGRTGGGDLSQLIARLPQATLADLKPGQAVMIVASGSIRTAGPIDAITLLSGVEPLLAASPQGGSFNLSPWSLGGGGGEGGGEAPAQ